MLAEFIRKWWLIAFFVIAAIMYFFAFAGWKVQEDAKKRGLGQAAVTFWSVAVVFFGFIFLPLYMLFRSRAVFAGVPGKPVNDKSYKLCPHCGEKISADELVCPKCSRRTDIEMADMGKKACTFCGAMNPTEAERCDVCGQTIGYGGNE